MNINQLRYFVSLGDTRSFTQVAQQHFLTQTAITQQIRTLEDTLGIQLIDRSVRPIDLTPAGKLFYQEAKNILAHLDSAVIRTREASAGLTGIIRIGYEKGFEHSSISEKLRDFHHKYPNILLSCIRDNTEQLASRLLGEDLDVIFGWDSTNLRQREDIGSRLIGRSSLVVALYDSHPFANRSSLRREDLKHERMIYMCCSSNGDSFKDAFFMQLYEKAGYQPNILLKSNDPESILMMVAAEQAISIMPSYCVKYFANPIHLTFVPLLGDEECEDIYMLWDKKRNTTAVNYFLEEPWTQLDQF
ncbi:MAG: LysR family transcriptional regulator [Dorea sp.]|nr:LysR family transcriptional regulator [Dorea sp.]